MEDWLDPRIAATNLLQIMARDRQKDTLPRILPFLGSILAEYNATLPETRDYQKKDGALVAVAAIAKVRANSWSMFMSIVFVVVSQGMVFIARTYLLNVYILYSVFISS